MNRKNDILVLLGAAVGGLLGYVLFSWLAGQGLYGLALPGGLLGLGAGVFKTRSKMVPIVCGLSALALGLFTEWRYEPFVADGSLRYFVLHVHQLQPITLLMVAAGTLIGFWVPFRRGQAARRARPSEEVQQDKTTENSGHTVQALLSFRKPRPWR
jgi:hypothetical protein